jgi:hypothetical protein
VDWIIAPAVETILLFAEGEEQALLRVRRHKDTVSLDTPRISGDIRVSIVFSS